MHGHEFVDPLLGDLSEIIEADLVTAALRAQWPGEGATVAVESTERHWVRYSPDNECVAVHRVHAELDGRPATTFAVATRTGAGTTWTTAVDDPELVELPIVLDQARIADVFGPETSGGQATPLQYRPGRRCTLHIQSDQGSVFAKLLSSGAATQRQFIAQAPGLDPHGFSFPPLARTAAPERFVVTEPVEGKPAWTILKSGPACSEDRSALSHDIGLRLARLHRLSSQSLATSSLADEILTLTERLNVIDRLDPATGLTARSVLANMRAANSVDSGPAATCHGSFRFDQIMVGADHVTLMDFDSLSAADPELDLGNCLAYLRWRQIRHPNSNDDLRQVGSSFLEGYQHAGGTIDRVRLASYFAASCLKIAWRRYANLDVVEWPLVADLLSTANDTLSSPASIPQFVTPLPTVLRAPESEVAS